MIILLETSADETHPNEQATVGHSEERVDDGNILF